MKSPGIQDSVSPLFPTELGSEGAQATAAKDEAQAGEEVTNIPLEPEEVKEQRVPTTPSLPTLSELQQHRTGHGARIA